MHTMRKLLSDYLFLGFVVIPTVCSVVYFGVIASNVYISESRFIVRTPDKPSMTGVGVMLKNAGFSNASDEAYAANDFILSRDALEAINAKDYFRNSYSDHGISVFNRFDPLHISPTFESLYKYFKGKVKADDNATTGITTLTVRAYNPVDARKFNEELLEMAEATVNRLNNRARDDLILFATREVQDCEENAQKAAIALAAYRNSHDVIDPEKQATTQLQTLSKFEDTLIATRAQLSTMQRTAASNPGVKVLQNRIESLSREMAAAQTKIMGQDTSLASKASEYQGLILADEIAAKELTAAVASLNQAQTEARRQQSYVERIAQPSLPDAPGEPYRVRDVIATFLLGLILWSTSRMLKASVLEHMD